MIKHAENNAKKKNLEFIKLISEFTALQTTNKYLDACFKSCSMESDKLVILIYRVSTKIIFY